MSNICNQIIGRNHRNNRFSYRTFCNTGSEKIKLIEVSTKLRIILDILIDFFRIHYNIKIRQICINGNFFDTSLAEISLFFRPIIRIGS